MAIAGYTKTTYVNDTTPAINATNLNNIEQQVKDISDAAVNGGASPTKIWTDTNDGLDSALEAGDAGKVSRYGIGTIGNEITDLHSITKSGIFTFATNTTNAPSTSEGELLGIVRGTDQKALLTLQPGNEVYYKIMYGTWGNWGKFWTTLNDGNGGQPPAPKPFTTANAVGEWKYCTRYVGGASDDTGTWAYIVFSAAGAVEGASVVAGGTDLGSGKLALCWKVIA